MNASPLARNSSVESLRLLFICSIVLYHVYLYGTDVDYEAIFAWGSNPATAPHLSLYSFSKIGVTGFMFISGYYGIRVNKAKWVSMLLMLAFYAIILTLYFGTEHVTTYFTALLHPFDLWWFMACYCFICILSPLLEKGIEAVGRKGLAWVVAGMLLFTYIAHLLEGEHNLSLLLTIYMTARFLRLHPIGWFQRHSRLIALSALMLILLIPVAISILHLSPVLNAIALSNNNPLYLILSAALVVSADGHPSHVPMVNSLARSVLAIYIITDYEAVQQWLDPLLFPYVMDWYGLLLIPLVGLACITIDKLRIMLFRAVSKTTAF